MGDTVNKVLQRFKNFNFLTDEYKKKQWQRFKRLIQSTNESDEEKKLWETYKAIVTKSFKTDNQGKKFSLSHVEQLGVDYDILFLYSKKDVGKTWAAAKYIDRLLRSNPGAEIAFIRNSKEEAKGFIAMMNNSEIWPTWTNGELVYKKEDIKKNKGSVKRCKPCGCFAYCSGAGFARWQGGDWTNLRFWYWDECNSTQGGLTQEVFQALNVFLSSMIRDKQGAKAVKGLMTGNLLEKSNIFLERLGVGAKTNLKIFKVHRDNNPRNELLSTMLYLNTGDMFKGIEDQRGLATQFLTEDEYSGLISNRPGLYTGKAQYEEIDLVNFLPMFAFVFTDKVHDSIANVSKEVDRVLYVYRIPRSTRIVVWIDYFKAYNIKPRFKFIYCHDRRISNRYTMTIPIEDEEDFGDMFIAPIAWALYTGEVWFGWNSTEEVFNRCWPTLENKFLNIKTEEI